MGIAGVASVTLRGKPSLYHAHLSGFLEMRGSELKRFLNKAAEKNPCLEVEGCEVSHVIGGGELSILEEQRTPISPSGSAELYRSANILTEETDPYVDCICDDFSESLPVYLSTNMPSLKDSRKSLLCTMLIELIDNRGFLKEDPAYIAKAVGSDLEEIEEILDEIKSIDPGGIGSRDLQDFLWFQCREVGWGSENISKFIHGGLEYIALGKSEELCEKLGVGKTFIQSSLEKLRSLRPYPTWGMDFTASQYMQREHTAAPDLVFFCSESGEHMLHIIEPNIKLNLLPLQEGDDVYAENETNASGWKKSIRSMKKEAFWLSGVLEERRRIIVQVASVMLIRQMSYITGDEEYKEALTVSQIASELSIPISTVSRAIKNRVVATPRGTFKLKDLISQPFPTDGKKSVSQDYIRFRVRSLTLASDGKVRSDRQIAEILQSEGIEVARRTVNKYRRESVLVN